MYSTRSHSISLRSTQNVILPAVRKSYSLFLYKFLHKTMCAFSSLSYVLRAQSISYSLIWSPECYLGVSNNHAAPRYVSLFYLYYVQIPYLAPGSQTTSAYGLSLIWRPYSHSYKTKSKIKILVVLISYVLVQRVPLATETGISLIILPLMRILQRNLKRIRDTFLFISHTTNVPLFKFRCNICISVRIIK
jgi:hypothetical protein